MLVRALLVCSHEGCDAVVEAVGDPREIEALACDCGWGLQVIGWPEPVRARRELALTALA